MIGTSPDEYARSEEGMGQMIEDSTPEGPEQIHMSVDEVYGYEEGDVAWADSTGRFTRDDKTVATRFTTVFHREEGGWRCVQAFGGVGLTLGGIGFLVLAWLTYEKLALGAEIGGRPLLLLGVLLVLIGVQLVATGVIGEILTRIYHEPQGRPQYLLRRQPRKGS